MRQYFWFGTLEVCEALLDRPCDELFLDRLGDLAVQVLPAALEQRVIRCILHQCVLEGVSRLRWRTSAKRQPGVCKLDKYVVELFVAQRRYRPNQFVAEFAPDHGSDLRQFFHWRRSIQARHQRVS